MEIIRSERHPQLYIVKHPLLEHKLTMLRDENTLTKEFRELTYEIGLMLGIAATENFPVNEHTISTPLENFTGVNASNKAVVIIPILRAGLGLQNSLLTLMPWAKVGHIGVFRDEKSLLPHRYYFKIPRVEKSAQFFIIDPMLATGGSAIDAVRQLKEYGISNITFISIVAASEGVNNLTREFPNIRIYTASLDRELNASSYILPGLGDAGDRLFDTEDHWP